MSFSAQEAFLNITNAPHTNCVKGDCSRGTTFIMQHSAHLITLNAGYGEIYFCSISQLQSYLPQSSAQNVFQPTDTSLCLLQLPTPLLHSHYHGYYYNELFFFCQADRLQFHTYSTLFSDSTISIFFNLKCITIFTKTEKPHVKRPLYKKLTGLIFLPNITASTSTVVIT